MSEEAYNRSGMVKFMLNFHSNPAQLQAAGLEMDRTTPITTPITALNTTPKCTRSIKPLSLILDKSDISEQDLEEAQP
jgi:hypothetical protein